MFKRLADEQRKEELEKKYDQSKATNKLESERFVRQEEEKVASKLIQEGVITASRA